MVAVGRLLTLTCRRHAAVNEGKRKGMAGKSGSNTSSALCAATR
jgi:hypothetical protein